MHPQVWKCSGHYDLFHDFMVDCRESKKRYRHDQIVGRWVEAKGKRVFVTTQASETCETEIESKALKFFRLRSKNREELKWDSGVVNLTEIEEAEIEEESGQILVALAEGQADGSVIAEIIVNGGLQLTELKKNEMDLEDVFLQVTHGETQ